MDALFWKLLLTGFLAPVAAVIAFTFTAMALGEIVEHPSRRVRGVAWSVAFGFPALAALGVGWTVWTQAPF